MRNRSQSTPYEQIRFGARHTMAWAITVALVAVILVASALVLHAHGGSASAGQRVRTSVSTKDITPRSPTMVTVKVCEDPTTSSSPTFIAQFVEELTTDIRSWAPPSPTSPPSAAVPARPGLVLWVRTVGTYAYATNQESVEVEVPAIPALAAPPKLSDPSLAVDQVAWAKREAAWASDVQAARAAANKAAATVAGIPLDESSTNMSAIWQCMAALAGSGTQDAATRMILASDLQNNEPSISASYQASSILIDQSCPADAIESCAPLAQRWVTQLRARGSGPVTVVRADAAAKAVEQWLSESAS